VDYSLYSLGIVKTKNGFIDMGESERYIDYKHQKRKSSLSDRWAGNATLGLILLNVLFLVTLMSIKVGYQVGEHPESSFTDSIIKYLVLPESFSAWIDRPWTIITFMFTGSASPMFALLANLFWLYVFGDLLRKQGGNEWVVPIYLYGGLLGGLFFMMGNMFFAGTGTAQFLMGCGLPVTALAAASLNWSPTYRMLTRQGEGYGVPLWVVFIIWLVLDGMTWIGRAPGFWFAHGGALLTGFLYTVLLKKSLDPGRWMIRLYRWFMQALKPAPKESMSQVRNRNFYQTGNRPPYVRKQTINETQIDQILDKINESGYNSLTEEEKMILKRSSEEN
jgi:membrane associated rhomboid family serine protease